MPDYDFQKIFNIQKDGFDAEELAFIEKSLRIMFHGEEGAKELAKIQENLSQSGVNIITIKKDSLVTGVGVRSGNEGDEPAISNLYLLDNFYHRNEDETYLAKDGTWQTIEPDFVMIHEVVGHISNVNLTDENQAQELANDYIKTYQKNAKELGLDAPEFKEAFGYSIRKETDQINGQTVDIYDGNIGSDNIKFAQIMLQAFDDQEFSPEEQTKLKEMAKVNNIDDFEINSISAHGTFPSKHRLNESEEFDLSVQVIDGQKTSSIIVR